MSRLHSPCLVRVQILGNGLEEFRRLAFADEAGDEGRDIGGKGPEV